MRRFPARLRILFGTVLTVLCLVVLLLTTISCSPTSFVEYEPYPVFPPRVDPLVVANPTSHPTAPAPAGKLDEWLLGLNAIGGKVYDTTAIDAKNRSEIDAVLEKLFGSPSQPRVDSDDPAVVALKLTDADLVDAGRLYRRHCANCHGVTADGRGPAGLFVYPHPRDVRLGKMKFVSSTTGTNVPTRADLTKVIKAGVPGTSMPPFALADEATIDKLTSATIHLSLRGEVESKLLLNLVGDGDGPPADWEVEARRLLAASLAKWAAAEREVIAVPTETPDDEASIRRGQALFVSARAGCVSCHEDYGRKDAYRFDTWGTAARVANLTEREFRGGREPADLFKRIRLGIPTVGMPAQPAMTDGEVWDLVHFVRAVGTPAKLPADVRRLIYPD